MVVTGQTCRLSAGQLRIQLSARAKASRPFSRQGPRLVASVKERDREQSIPLEKEISFSS